MASVCFGEPVYKLYRVHRDQGFVQPFSLEKDDVQDWPRVIVYYGCKMVLLVNRHIIFQGGSAKHVEESKYPQALLHYTFSILKEPTRVKHSVICR